MLSTSTQNKDFLGKLDGLITYAEESFSNFSEFTPIHRTLKEIRNSLSDLNVNLHIHIPSEELCTAISKRCAALDNCIVHIVKTDNDMDLLKTGDLFMAAAEYSEMVSERFRNFLPLIVNKQPKQILLVIEIRELTPEVDSEVQNTFKEVEELFRNQQSTGARNFIKYLSVPEDKILKSASNEGTPKYFDSEVSKAIKDCQEAKIHNAKEAVAKLVNDLVNLLKVEKNKLEIEQFKISGNEILSLKNRYTQAFIEINYKRTEFFRCCLEYLSNYSRAHSESYMRDSLDSKLVKSIKDLKIDVFEKNSIALEQDYPPNQKIHESLILICRDHLTTYASDFWKKEVYDSSICGFESKGLKDLAEGFANSLNALGTSVSVPNPLYSITSCIDKLALANAFNPDRLIPFDWRATVKPFNLFGLISQIFSSIKGLLILAILAIFGFSGATLPGNAKLFATLLPILIPVLIIVCTALIARKEDKNAAIVNSRDEGKKYYQRFAKDYTMKVDSFLKALLDEENKILQNVLDELKKQFDILKQNIESHEKDIEKLDSKINKLKSIKF
jgi:hypothetical protein